MFLLLFLFSFTLNVVTFFQRERNSLSFSLPDTDVCDVVKEHVLFVLALCATFLPCHHI